MEIKFEEKMRRAAAYNEEGTIIGDCTFSVNDGVWDINHTGVSDGYQGQGIGTKMVKTIYEEAKERGVKLTATCPFAAKVLESKLK